MKKRSGVPGIREFCYYFRDENKRPVITVILLINVYGNFARGIAICSDQETPVINSKAHMRNGPGLARRRAHKALKEKKNLFLILRGEPRVIIYKNQETLKFFNHVTYFFKATYNGKLSDYETTLLKKNGYVQIKNMIIAKKK